MSSKVKRNEDIKKKMMPSERASRRPTKNEQARSRTKHQKENTTGTSTTTPSTPSGRRRLVGNTSKPESGLEGTGNTGGVRKNEPIVAEQYFTTTSDKHPAKVKVERHLLKNIEVQHESPAAFSDTHQNIHHDMSSNSSIRPANGPNSNTTQHERSMNFFPAQRFPGAYRMRGPNANEEGESTPSLVSDQNHQSVEDGSTGTPLLEAHAVTDDELNPENASMFEEMFEQMRYYVQQRENAPAAMPVTSPNETIENFNRQESGNVSNEREESDVNERGHVPFWKRRNYFLSCLALIVLIGVAVTLAVLLSKNSSSEPNPSSTVGAPPPDAPSEPTTLSPTTSPNPSHPATLNPTQKSNDTRPTTTQVKTSPPTTMDTESPILMPTEQPNPSEMTNVTLVLKTDTEPTETGWTMDCGNSGRFREREGDLREPLQRRKLWTHVPHGTECEFSISDAVGDGICCVYGDGRYKITIGEDEYPIANGGEFGGLEKVRFRVEPPETFRRDELVAVTVRVNLDVSQDETSWLLQCGTTSMESSDFNSINQLRSGSLIVPRETGCVFTISDTAGDGINPPVLGEHVVEIYVNDQLKQFFDFDSGYERTIEFDSSP